MQQTLLAPDAAAPGRIKSRSLWRDAWHRLIGAHTVRFGMFILVTFTLMAILPPLLLPYDPQVDSSLSMRLEPPSWVHPFGTDGQGRDVLVRILHGSRVS